MWWLRVSGVCVCCSPHTTRSKTRRNGRNTSHSFAHTSIKWAATGGRIGFVGSGIREIETAISRSDGQHHIPLSPR
uniref:Putative secreted protein n=1 Tax=Anopheles triannulatus TaxID=58253 RepID=A0A2M4B6N5_9DIPT